MMRLSISFLCVLVIGYLESGWTCTCHAPIPVEKTSCTKIKSLVGGKNGTYKLYINNDPTTAYQAYCEFSSDGDWMVMMRRKDATVSFDETWQNYKDGFGDLTGNFWLGNKWMNLITKKHAVTAKFTTIGVNATVLGRPVIGGTKSAQYSTFVVGNEADNFTLTIGGHSGELYHSMAYHNGAAFSTKDRNNDGYNCADPSTLYGDGGWWYKGQKCAKAVLTGKYQTPGFGANFHGIYWYNWTAGLETTPYYKLKYADIKIKF